MSMSNISLYNDDCIHKMKKNTQNDGYDFIERLLIRFANYQIDWLTSHNDIEFCEEKENLICGFINDTTVEFLREIKP